ncbi:MAG: TlyA family RNA methyltransferase [Candidatus Microthrix parvicella]|jgi:23S rRNA (cytidine1920-2'-O)/16S rRNA (cytidine1409-2'-O)-methyltransferase|uniref:Predicted rRNA methylase n=2 Tax=Microthrixaceae TaxID=1798913 RepID=R4Z370_9ACTN|nr:TlyA family RNA methyltransferase [Candidatus Microthrix sp.]NLH65336.1 TlyA family RNA methyltransferase [Candidatus Microthrix parvicella]CCM63731.1 Predicted rRNA methylase [Candidatus Microthrix parvicella RN1]MBK7021619.1 TlyA family RNA methyltransferase [Candidatus Microthrix sp.]MBP6150642.1 TlyA family RNA methyltransferase [Candidatus Microthrix sp.]
MVRRGLAVDAVAAASLVAAGRVLVGGAPALTPKRLTDDGEPVRVLELRAFVGRGGDKLDGALVALALAVNGRRVLDVGSSTGGFTDCLLQRGADAVVAIDVGTHQLSQSLRDDERVTVLEQTDIRSVQADSLGGRFGLVTVDVSFISLGAIMRALAGLMKPDGDLLVLVKPQFEVARSDASRGRGVIRSPKLWTEALESVVEAAGEHGLTPLGATVSGVRGAKGNTEFFVRLGLPGNARTASPSGWMKDLVESAGGDENE